MIKFIADLISASAASVTGLVWAAQTGTAMPPVWMMACYAPMILVIFALRSTYRRTLHNTLVGEFVSVQMTAALAAILLLAGMVLTSVPGNLADTIAKVWLATAILLPLGRVSAIVAKRCLRRRRFLQSPTLIMGNGQIACRLATRFAANAQFGIEPVGLIDTDQTWIPAANPCPIPIVGTPRTIAEAIQQTGAEAMVVGFSATRDAELIPAIRTAQLAGLNVWVVPRMFDIVAHNSRVDFVGGLPVLTLSNTNPDSWQFAVKHIADRVIAAAVLGAIAPLFLFLMAAVKVSSPGPVFFRQTRVGRDGIAFECLKFRSMRLPRTSDATFALESTKAPGGVEGTDRRTAIGRLMRCSSLDELPQLLNVIQGQMSLVGPRPERPEFVARFNHEIRRYGERHRVKAGMTGWAQVHGLRGQTSIDDRAELDNFYIENWSLVLDLQILLMTVAAVLRPTESPTRTVLPASSTTSNSPMPSTVSDTRCNHIRPDDRCSELHVVTSATAIAASESTQALREWLALHVHLTTEQNSDIILAAYEALSNCAEHAYADQTDPAEITLDVTYNGTAETLHVCVADRGSWIEGPADPTRGRGLQLMRALADDITLDHDCGGTTVCLTFEDCIPRGRPATQCPKIDRPHSAVRV